MRWCRFGSLGQEAWGLVDKQGQVRDASSILIDLADPLPILSDFQVQQLPLVAKSTRLASCVPRPGKFIGIGLNYSDHAEETGMAIPELPIMFMKATSSICGPMDKLILPPNAVKTDWEIELAFVIGKPAKNVALEDALSHVAGYMVCNDTSDRGFQLEHGGQWTKGKSADTYGPLGPVLVTPDLVEDPQNLRLWTKVNGAYVQNGSSQTMIFTVAEIIAHLSQYMTLETGDVVTTGTPPGCGIGMKPQRFLKAGDVVEVGIDGLGAQRQTVVQS